MPTSTRPLPARTRPEIATAADGGTRIFTSAHYAIDHFPGQASSGKLAITFTERFNRTLEGVGFGGRFLIRNGFDVLAVKGDRDRWLQDLPPDAFDAANRFLAALPEPPRWRACYGSSMGAYAALRFARELQADVAVAISPQFDVTAEWDTRWAEHVAPPMQVMDPGMVRPGCTYAILYDPRDADLLHYRRFATAIPPAQLFGLALPFSGHPSGPALAGAGVLQDVARCLLEGRLEAISPRALRRAIHVSKEYRFRLGEQSLSRGHLGWAQSLFAGLLAGDPLDPLYNIRAASVARLRNDIEHAIMHAATAVAAAPDSAPFNMILGRLLARKRLGGAALHYMDAAISRRPQQNTWREERAAVAAGLTARSAKSQP